MGPSSTPHHRRTGRSSPAWAVVALAVGLAGCTGTASDEEADAPVPPAARRSVTIDPPAVSAAVGRYLDDIYSLGKDQIRVVLVMVDGTPVVERYRGGASASTSMDTYSVTKTVTATLVGIAVGEGLLSLDERLEALLPTHADVMSPAVASITLEQLLTMTGGLPGDLPGGRLNPEPSGTDWVREFLAHGTVQTPGVRFAYSSASSHLLAAILVEATGMPVIEYARPRLLDPLGIDTTDAALPRLRTAAGDGEVQRRYDAARFAWLRDPTGLELGCCSLKLSAADMAKLGQLYLQEGRWEGRQLVPATWVHQATSAQVATVPPDFLEAYGFQWWVFTARGHPAYAAVGFGGQLVEVVPDLRLVVVTTVQVSDREMRLQHLTTMVSDAVIPALGG